MILPVFLPHLGCGTRCIYCNQDLITHGATEPLRARLERLLGPEGPPVEVALYGGNPLGLPYEALSSLFDEFEPYRDRVRGIRLSTKPTPVDARVVRLLKDRHVTTIELGMPCFDDAVLDTLRRGHTVSEFRETYLQLRSGGFEVGLQVMVGLPGETPLQVECSAAELTRLEPAFLRIYPLVVLEGTPLAAMYRSGAFLPVDLAEAVDRALSIYLAMWARHVPVARMGLVENEALRQRIVAGPYHPAFGYLVKCRAMGLAVRACCEKAGLWGKVSITLNRADVPHLIGYRRAQAEELERHGLLITRETGDIPMGHFMITDHRTSARGSLIDALRAARP